MSAINSKNVSRCYICKKEGVKMYSGLKERIYSTQGTWDFYTCKECDLMWLNPQPRINELQKIYADYFTHTQQKKKGVNQKDRIKRGLFKMVLPYFQYPAKSKNRIKRVIGSLLSLLPTIKERTGREIRWVKYKKDGKLLDIGCGNGEYLAWMRSLGWNVTGVEPDIKAVANADKTLNIHMNTISKVILPKTSFDVITLNHVIEHLPDPIAALNKFM